MLPNMLTKLIKKENKNKNNIFHNMEENNNIFLIEQNR